MRTNINCTKHLDGEHSRVWESTCELIESSYSRLLREYPDMIEADLHLRAFGTQTEVHLLLHGSKNRIIEAHAAGEVLDRAIVTAFGRAEAQLVKPKSLQGAL